jgi:hypothetical protein
MTNIQYCTKMHWATQVFSHGTRDFPAFLCSTVYLRAGAFPYNMSPEIDSL